MVTAIYFLCLLAFQPLILPFPLPLPSASVVLVLHRQFDGALAYSDTNSGLFNEA